VSMVVTVIKVNDVCFGDILILYEYKTFSVSLNFHVSAFLKLATGIAFYTVFFISEY
jgi:hypothetical protein